MFMVTLQFGSTACTPPLCRCAPEAFAAECLVLCDPDQIAAQNNAEMAAPDLQLLV